jgi:hypothetical protein
MTCAVSIFPIDGLDREQTLMDRLVEQSPTAPDVSPQHRVGSLLGVLGETISLVNSGSYANELTVHANLCALLVAGAGVARQFDITLYHGDVWPDECRTRIGGDGALAMGHDPRHLLGELLEAAGWIAEWVQDRTTPAVGNAAPTWSATEPVTELIARTWALADRWEAREPLRALVNEYLGGPSVRTAT